MKANSFMFAYIQFLLDINYDPEKVSQRRTFVFISALILLSGASTKHMCC